MADKYYTAELSVGFDSKDEADDFVHRFFQGFTAQPEHGDIAYSEEILEHVDEEEA